MARFLNHDAIGAGVFNREYSSADNIPGGAAVWRDVLQSSPGALELVIARMDSDYVNSHSKLRKPWRLAELVP